MLPKIARLTEDKDFSLIYRKGRRLSSANLRIFILKQNQNIKRFGFVLGKKAIPKSTGRNRVKRILRAAIRQKLDRLEPGHDVIIQGQAGCKSARPALLRSEVWGLLEKAKLLT